MAKNPSFSFYAQDFLVDTMQWNYAAKGLHCELLCVAWINGFLEANDQGEPVALGREALLIWRARVRHKWYLDDKKLYNSKLEKVRLSRTKFIDSQKLKGLKSAQKRSTGVEPRLNPGSTAVQPGFPVEPFEDENIVFKKIRDLEKKKDRDSEESKRLLEPFFGEDFLPTWQTWKDYKSGEHHFRYKTSASEQQAIVKLAELSNKDPGLAETIIRESIANGWKGFFEIKNQHNGKATTGLREPARKRTAGNDELERSIQSDLGLNP